MFRTVRSWKSAVQIAAVFIVAVGAWSAARPARADFNLLIATDNTYGLIARQGTDAITGTTADNPLHLDVGNVHAALSNNGSNIKFAFTVDPSGESAGITTAAGLQGIVSIPSELKFMIVGTNGEAIGTPVTLELHTGFVGTANEVTNSIDDNDFAPHVDKTLGNYKVGDTFRYWASVGVNAGDSASFDGTLLVRALGAPSAAPEPGTLVLLVIGTIARLGFLRRRNR